MSTVNRIKWAVIMWFTLALCSACAMITSRHIKQAREVASVAAQSLECIDESMQGDEADGRPNDADQDGPKPDMGE